MPGCCSAAARKWMRPPWPPLASSTASVISTLPWALMSICPPCVGALAGVLSCVAATLTWPCSLMLPVAWMLKAPPCSGALRSMLPVALCVKLVACTCSVPALWALWAFRAFRAFWALLAAVPAPDPRADLRSPAARDVGE